MNGLPDVTRCPVCRGDSTVADSRKAGGALRRRRKCLNPVCDWRWSTYEVPIEMMSDSGGGTYERCRRALAAVERAQTELVEAMRAMRAEVPVNGTDTHDAVLDGQDATAGGF